MDALGTLRRKPDLVKVLVAAGIACAGKTGADLVLPVLASEFWGTEMAELGSAVAASRAAVQLVATPLFGRWCDTVPRKWAFLVMGLATWLPIWPLLLLGRSSSSLWWSSAASVLSGICGSTVVGYALINDFTTAAERTGVMAFGTALIVLVQWLPKLVVALVRKAYPANLFAPCYVDVLSLLLFCCCTVWIGRPPGSASDESGQLASEDCQPDLRGQSSAASTSFGAWSRHEPASDEESESEGGSGSSSEEESGLASSSVLLSPARGILAGGSVATCTSPVAAAVAAAVGSPASVKTTSTTRARDGHSVLETLDIRKTFWLICGSRDLLLICGIFTMVSLPEIAEMEVTPQFTFQAFGLLTPSGYMQISHLIFISQYSSMVSMCLLSALAGVLGKCMGLVVFVRWLLPVTALAELLPCLYLWEPKLSVLGVVSALSPLSVLIGIPLNTLVTLMAPPDRMAESLCAMSMCRAFSVLFGSLAVPPIVKLAGSERLWLFYLLGASSTLLALPAAFWMREPRPEGDDAGRSAECSP